MDWNLVRSFVAVAEQGSMSAAARALRTSQPTLSRHIATLEDHLGVRLFVRHARGLTLTREGTALFERAATVRDAFGAFERGATGLDPDLAGTVRITASEVVAVHVLPAWVAGMRREHPGIDLEVVADNRATNLLRRDADIAVRMYPPTQLDLVARHVADSELGLYAHDDYLADAPPLDGLDVDALRRHTVLGLDRDDLFVRTLDRLGLSIPRGAFAVRSDCQPFHVEALRHGAGIVAAQRAIAERIPGVRRVAPDVSLGVLPVWLVAHEDVRRSPRVRACFDHLFAWLRLWFVGPPAAEDPPR